MKCKFIVENFTHESSYTDLVKAIKAIVGGTWKVSRRYSKIGKGHEISSWP